MAARSLKNIENATLNSEAYSNNLTQIKIGNLTEFNTIQYRVNILYSSIDLSGGGEGPVQDVVNAINDISTEINSLQANVVANTEGIVEIQQNILSINNLTDILDTTNADNVFVDTSNITITGEKTFAGGLRFSKLDVAGFVRNGNDGSLTASGLLNNADFSSGAAISQDKLATITSAGKVTNAALSASSTAVPNTIAARDSMGGSRVPMPAAGAYTHKVAPIGFAVSELSRVVDNAQTTLDTLEELANALNNDPQFSQSVEAELNTKAYAANSVFTGNAVVTGNIVVSTLATPGIIHNDASGLLYSSQLTIDDISGIIFKNENIETITSPGKVANSATTATTNILPNTIVMRDSLGMLPAHDISMAMYRNLRENDPSWNTWGYYPLRKTRMDGMSNVLASYAFSFSNTIRWPISGTYSIAWSPELGIMVGANRSGGFESVKFVYTRDFVDNWTSVFIRDIYTYNEVLWARELMLFVAIGNHILYSTDGATWSRNGVVIPNNINYIHSCWSSELGLFVAVGTNNVIVSRDGKIWQSVTVPQLTWNTVIWIAELGIFVVSASNATMWSKNGYDWVQNTATYPTAIDTITWSSELGIIHADTENPNVAYFSNDGKKWTQVTPTGSGLLYYKPIWSREFKMFFTISGFRHSYSFNGINWTLFNYSNTGQPNARIYTIPEYGLVVLFGGNINQPVVNNMNFTAPSSYRLFNGIYTRISEDGTFYFDTIMTSATLTYNSPINTYGVYGIESFRVIDSSQNVVCTDNARAIFTPSPGYGRILTCVNTNTTGNAAWCVPNGTRIDGIFYGAGANWANSGASGSRRLLARIPLPTSGVWLTYYKISLQAQSGSAVATQILSFLSPTNRVDDASVVSGSRSVYIDNFTKTISAGINTSYMPRTCLLDTGGIIGTVYMKAVLTFTGTVTNITVHNESYFYAIKIQ